MLAPYLAELLTQPRKMLNFIRKLRIARTRYGRPYRDLLARFFDLLLNAHFTPRQIFLGDMLGIDREDLLRSTISKTDLLRIQQALNPAMAVVLTEDKAIFSGYCRARNLPAPHLLLAVGRRLAWTAEGTILTGADQLISFLDRMPDSDIVIKPTHGAHGRGIRFLSHRGGCWSDEAGRIVTAREILQAVREDREFSDFVIQERVRPHPELARLSGTDYLQTARIITVVSEGAGAEVAFGAMKLIGGSATTDNVDAGSKGNMVGEISLSTGRLNWVRAPRPDGVGIMEATRHPVTGAVLPGFQLPFWPETLDLARRAAMAFLPLVTIGWDVAITPDGPLLIEGNAWWDPPILVPFMESFRAHARPLLKQPAALSQHVEGR